MGKPYTITGLDIGSSKVSAVTAEVGNDDRITVVAHVTQPSKGIERGLLADLNEATDSVSKTLSKLSEKTSRRIGDIYVNISGDTIKGARSLGMVALAARGREVVKADIDRCVGAASTIHLPFDREIVHRIVHRFSIDDQPWIRNPLGLYASRLSCEVYVITANVNHVQSIYKCVNAAGYDVKEIVYTGIADGASLLEAAQREGGALVIDIGNALTEISQFADGTLSELDVVPVGGRDMQGDFKSSPEFNGLLERVSARIRSLPHAIETPTLVITGGLVFGDGIVEYIEEKVGRPAKVGVVGDVHGNLTGADSMRLSTAIGLIKYAIEDRARKLSEHKGVVRRISDTVVDIFNSYF